MAATTALGLVSIFVLPTWMIPAQVVACLVIISLAYVWFAQAALRDAQRRVADAKARPDRPLEPRVRQSMIGDKGNDVTFLLDPSRLFGQSMIVSVYHEDERGFELLVAQGRVANIQMNGLIQITITAWQDGHDALRMDIINQRSGILDKLIVKPAPATEVAFQLQQRDDLDRVFLTYLQNISEPVNDR